MPASHDGIQKEISIAYWFAGILTGGKANENKEMFNPYIVENNAENLWAPKYRESWSAILWMQFSP